MGAKAVKAGSDCFTNNCGTVSMMMRRGKENKSR
jgi:hypothetical protein